MSDLVTRLRDIAPEPGDMPTTRRIMLEAAAAIEAQAAEIERLRAGWHDCITDLTAAQKRAEKAERALAEARTELGETQLVLEQTERNAARVTAEAVTVIQQGEAATNAAYSLAMAEYHGYDKTADKHDRAVTAFRHAARAFVAQHGSNSREEK